jgi:hypothetical protein
MMELSVDAFSSSSSFSSTMILGHMQGNERPVIVNLIGLDIVLVYDQQQQVHADDGPGDDEISLSDYSTTSDDSPIIGKEVPRKKESSSSSSCSCSSMITVQVGDSYFEDDSLKVAISRRILQVGDSYFEDDSLKKLTISRRVRSLPGSSSFANDDLMVAKNAMETTTTVVVLKLRGSHDNDEAKRSHPMPPAAVAAPDFLSTMKSLRISNSAA